MSGSEPASLRLRPEQRAVVECYRGGYAAIAAVPGAGKTTTLSALAAELIARGDNLGRDRHVMIVTYQNSGVSNFQRAVAARLRERGLPERGIAVRTLHGLANDVLAATRHRVRLDADLIVIDERDAHRLVESVVEEEIVEHSEALMALVLDREDGRSREWPSLQILTILAARAIDEAKQVQLDADSLRRGLRASADSRWLPFVASVFDRYERALRERGALDFNDLVTRAVAALEQDPSLAARLRQRWPYLLEDEAQDSTPLQERMLRLIAGPGGNLVRVGDGNQAIMTSFTSSDAQGFRDWLSDPAVQRFTLAGSSRSAQSILTLANHFSDRVRDAYPVVGARTALLHQPIAPVIGPAGLENPLSYGPHGITIRDFETTDDEHTEVVGRAVRWLRAHPGDTVAVLAGRGETGYALALRASEHLPQSRIIRLLGSKDGRPVELIDRIEPVIIFLLNPDQPRYLSRALERWSTDPDADRVVAAFQRRERDPELVAGLFYPRRSPEAIAAALDVPSPWTDAEAATLRRLAHAPAWLDARLSPPHDLLALVAATIEPVDADRATFNRVIATIRDAEPDPDRDRLANLLRWLQETRDRHRRLRGTPEDDSVRVLPGTLTVSTFHQAKGLEWDVVFATGCDDYWFPGSLEIYRPQMRNYLGPGDPLVESRNELRALARAWPPDHPLRDPSAALEADSIEVVAERLRLLYVALTRARRALWISWHRAGHRPQRESPVLPILQSILSEVIAESR